MELAGIRKNLTLAETSQLVKWHEEDGLTFGEIAKRLRRATNVVRRRYERAVIQRAHGLRPDCLVPLLQGMLDRFEISDRDRSALTKAVERGVIAPQVADRLCVRYLKQHPAEVFGDAWWSAGIAPWPPAWEWPDVPMSVGLDDLARAAALCHGVSVEEILYPPRRGWSDGRRAVLILLLGDWLGWPISRITRTLGYATNHACDAATQSARCSYERSRDMRDRVAAIQAAVLAHVRLEGYVAEGSISRDLANAAWADYTPDQHAEWVEKLDEMAVPALECA